MGGKLTKMDLATDRPIYDRQPKEPDKAWGVFVIYRDMGPERSIRKAESKYKETHGGKGDVNYCEKLSVRWRWRERVEAWDGDLDRRLRAQRIRALEDMQRRHIEQGKSLQALGASGAKQLYEELKRKANDPDGYLLTAKEIVALIEAGTKLERLNLGEPDSISEQRHVIDDDEKRAAIRKLARDPDALKAIEQALDDDASPQ